MCDLCLLWWAFFIENTWHLPSFPFYINSWEYHAGDLFLAESACSCTLTSQSGTCKYFFSGAAKVKECFLINIYLRRNQEIVFSVKMKLFAYLNGRVKELAGQGTHIHPPIPTLFSLLEMLFENSRNVMLVLFINFRCLSITRHAQFTMNCSMCGSNSELAGFSTLS